MNAFILILLAFLIIHISWDTKTLKLTALGFFINYIFAAIYVLISPIGYPIHLNSFREIIDYLIATLQIPLIWCLSIEITFSYFFEFFGLVIEKAETFTDLFAFPPIFASVFMLLAIVALIALKLFGKWQNLQVKFKFSLLLFISLCFNIILLDCFAIISSA